MGLKFKRFRAKLTWKTKETVPEVVCLRYNIHSEFDNANFTPIPATSTEVATRLRTSDLKQRLAASKLPVQGATPAFTNINGSNVNSSVKASGAVIINHNGIDTSAPTKSIDTNHDVKATDTADSNQNSEAVPASKPRGILKKASTDEDAIKEPEVIVKSIPSQPANGNITLDKDINGKSALIFMTENHDDNDSFEINNNKNTILHESNARKEQIEYTAEVKDTDHEQRSHASDAKNDTDEYFLRLGGNEDETQDGKAVNWRQTIEYYSDDELETSKQSEVRRPKQDDFDKDANEQQASDFKIHFVKHEDLPVKDLDSEDGSETESECETEVDRHYRNSTAYSSQAASIFFAGEEPEPTLRVRNKSRQDDAESSVA